MDGSGVVMRILNKDEITTDEKMNNSYAELLYIPHICRGRADDVRVNFFWPV